jgi:hypothetical protein
MFLRELFEAASKTAVIAFGRLNPPTIGHAKLVGAIKSYDGDHYLFLSQTHKPKTDPLDFATKIKFAKQFFPDINIGHSSVRTPVQALEKMQSLGYTDIIFVAGSDRVDGFQKLFDTYNGQPDKSGNVPFKFNSIKVVSAGERDPDADGAEGMSASKMRAAAAAGDLEAFAQGVPDKKLAQTMYDAVRKGMGVKDAVAAEDVSPEDEDKFHNELDNLVHKYFGDSPDEEKMKKKMRKVKEDDQVDEIIAPIARGVAAYATKKLSKKVIDKTTNKKVQPTQKSSSSNDNTSTFQTYDKTGKIKEVGPVIAALGRAAGKQLAKSIATTASVAYAPGTNKNKPKKTKSSNDADNKRGGFTGTGEFNEGDLVLDHGKLRSFIIDMIADKINKTDDIEQLSKWLKMIVGKEVNPRGAKRYTISAEDVVEACNRRKRKSRG